MTMLVPRKTRREFAWAAVVAIAWLGANCRRATADDTAWAWTPYRTAIVVAADGRPQFTPALVAEVRDRLARRVREEFGAAWQTEFAQLSPADADKVFSVNLTYADATYGVAVEEYDAVCRSSSSAVRRATTDRAALADAAADALSAAFRPLARIADVRADNVALQLRAGMLMNDDLRTRCAEPRTGFTPYVRRRDRDGNVVSVEAIPWTLLEVAPAADSVPGTFSCVVRSGVRNPLAARLRSRTDRPALAAGRPTGATRIVVRAKQDGEPLAGLNVYAAEEDQARLLGRTDAGGTVTLADDAGLVTNLLVTGRFVPLARVPLIVGLAPEVVVPVPADERLRAAEDWLADWQSEFIDLYVRRRMAASLASIRIERQDFAVAAAWLSRLDKLDPPHERIAELETYRRRHVGNDPQAKLVENLFADVLGTVRALDDTAAVAELRMRLTKESPPPQ